MIDLTTMTQEQFDFAMTHSMMDNSGKSFRRADLFDDLIELKNAYHRIVEMFGEKEPKMIATLIGNDSLFGYAYMSAANWHIENGEWTGPITERIFTPPATIIFRFYDIYVKQAAMLGIVEEENK